MDELGKQAHELADHLGDNHDLAVLRDLLGREGDQWAAPGTLMKLLDLIDVRRGELQQPRHSSASGSTRTDPRRSSSAALLLEGVALER